MAPSRQVTSKHGVAAPLELGTVPLLNITMPVFNRFHMTQKALLHLHKLRHTFPFVITVVDNGSEAPLQEQLLRFYHDGIIDKLFLLEKNMGIACACNIGWRSRDTPYFMKLDNDIMITNKDFFQTIFSMWKCVEPLSNIGSANTRKYLEDNPEFIETPYGRLHKMTAYGNLPGCALIIPRDVYHILGGFNEDYELYGGEDGDYGARMRVAGLPQYYYKSWDFFVNEGGVGDTTFDYKGHGLDKQKEHDRLFSINGTIGLFNLNCYLYELCIRSWKVPYRYEEYPLDETHYGIRECAEYQKIRLALERSKKIVDAAIKRSSNIHAALSPFTDATVAKLKEIWRNCGQECTIDNMLPEDMRPV